MTDTDGEAARDRARQVAQGRPRRARRHLPLRRARLRRDHSPTTWRCSAGTASTRSARRSPRPAASPGPSEETDGLFMLRIKFPGGERDLGAAAADRPAGRALRPRHGRHHDPPEHPAAQPAHRGPADRAGRAERGRPLVHPGLRRRLAQHRRLPAGRRRRPRAARHAAADRGAGARVRRPPASSRTCRASSRCRSRPALIAARSTRSTTSGWSRSRRTAWSATTSGWAAGSAPRPAWAGGWTSSSRRRRRSRSAAAITELFRDEGKRTKRTRARIKFLVDEWGVERLPRRARATCSAATLPTSVEPGRADRSPPRPPGRPPAGCSAGLYYVGGTTLRGRFLADQMIGVADIADRYGSGQLRCTNRQNIIVLDVPDEHVETVAGRARRPRAADRGVRVPARHHLLHRAWSSASWRSSRPRSARRS